MGGMMGGTGMGAWLLVWVLLGLAVVAAGGLAAVRILGKRGLGDQAVSAAESAELRQAKDTLRKRYASGEISREDYLQGKVELED